MDVWGKKFPGRWNVIFKWPEIGVCLAFLMDWHFGRHLVWIGVREGRLEGDPRNRCQILQNLEGPIGP